MRANVVHGGSRRVRSPLAAGLLYRLRPEEDYDEHGSGASSTGPDPIEREDLPYKVELWNAGKNSVEQVLAVTASGSIGYAAFYGATREYPDRYITLRHKTSIISRWNGPSN
jgi:hypothetical protein